MKTDLTVCEFELGDFPPPKERLQVFYVVDRVLRGPFLRLHDCQALGVHMGRVEQTGTSHSPCNSGKVAVMGRLEDVKINSSNMHVLAMPWMEDPPQDFGENEPKRTSLIRN